MNEGHTWVRGAAQNEGQTRGRKRHLRPRIIYGGGGGGASTCGQI
jgi:hypothetical protein